MYIFTDFGRPVIGGSDRARPFWLPLAGAQLPFLGIKRVGRKEKLAMGRARTFL